jgi:hypothetical protein
MNKKINNIIIAGFFTLLAVITVANADDWGWVTINPTTDKIICKVGGNVMGVIGDAGIYILKDGYYYNIPEASIGYKAISASILSYYNNQTTFYIGWYTTSGIYRNIGRVQNINY